MSGTIGAWSEYAPAPQPDVSAVKSTRRAETARNFCLRTPASAVRHTRVKIGKIEGLGATGYEHGINLLRRLLDVTPRIHTRISPEQMADNPK